MTYRAEAVRLELKRHFAAFIEDRQVDLSRWDRQVEVKFDFALTDGLALHGRIDRMEVSPEGEAVVIDYKYSAAVAIKGHVKGFEAGDKVQGGLYLLAAEREFGYRPAGMLYCGLKKGVTWGGWHSGVAGLEEVGERHTPDGILEMVRQTEQNVIETHAAIAAGDIAPRPLDESKCQWCEARDICRIESARQEHVQVRSGGAG